MSQNTIRLAKNTNEYRDLTRHVEDLVDQPVQRKAAEKPRQRGWCALSPAAHEHRTLNRFRMSVCR